jgi:hypothetical protein
MLDGTGVDYRGTAGNAGKGFVAADGFSATAKKVTFAPPSLATGAFATSSPIAVAGVKIGDSIELYPPYATQGVIYQASPSSAGNVVISLFNATAGTVALASGAWGISIKRGV